MFSEGRVRCMLANVKISFFPGRRGICPLLCSLTVQCICSGGNVWAVAGRRKCAHWCESVILVHPMPISAGFLFAMNNMQDIILRGRALLRSRLAVGLVLSVALHAAVLCFLFGQQESLPVPVGVTAPRPPLEMVWINPAPVAKAVPPAPKPDKPQPKPKPAAKVPPKSAAKVKPAKNAAPAKPPRLAQSATPSPMKANPAEPADMMSMLNAARERRQQQAAASKPAEDDIVQQNLARSLQQGDKHSGVFEILSKGTRVARYSFRGWSNSTRYSNARIIEVDAGSGGNVELAIIDSMIRLIRENYKEDFNWDSRRVGKVVVLSARPADTAQLRTFLMREFF